MKNTFFTIAAVTALGFFAPTVAQAQENPAAPAPVQTKVLTLQFEVLNLTGGVCTETTIRNVRVPEVWPEGISLHYSTELKAGKSVGQRQVSIKYGEDKGDPSQKEQLRRNMRLVVNHLTTHTDKWKCEGDFWLKAEVRPVPVAP